MMAVTRVALPTSAEQALDSKAAQVAAAVDKRAQVKASWRALARSAAGRSIRATLREMASGLDRCMYCEDGHGTDIEHFAPKVDYPATAFDWRNYLLACSECNSNAKRDQFPVDIAGKPLLINPAEDDPSAHLSLSITTGEFSPRKSGAVEDLKGLTSIGVFDLNRQVCTKGRYNALHVFMGLAILYAQLEASGQHHKSATILQAVRENPFQAVRQYAPDLAPQYAPAGAAAAFARHPELLN